MLYPLRYTFMSEACMGKGVCVEGDLCCIHKYVKCCRMCDMMVFVAPKNCGCSDRRSVQFVRSGGIVHHARLCVVHGTVCTRCTQRVLARSGGVIHHARLCVPRSARRQKQDGDNLRRASHERQLVAAQPVRSYPLPHQHSHHSLQRVSRILPWAEFVATSHQLQHVQYVPCSCCVCYPAVTVGLSTVWSVACCPEASRRLWLKSRSHYSPGQ